MDHPELVPLESGVGIISSLPSTRRGRVSLSSNSCCKGPLRAFRLLLLITLVPAMFIFIPVYLRYKVYSGQIYPVGMTDMRLIDNKISTTWCQRQVVKSNATFNAFLVSEKPEISNDLIPVSMSRDLLLEDDMKEYWGFYLLKGSLVTVSTCVRHPGASLIMIKDYKHLQDCAYIGDDSSEELEELKEAYEMGLLDNASLEKHLNKFRDSPANDPDAMKRHKDGVRFHDPSHTGFEPNTIVHHDKTNFNLDGADITDRDSKEFRAILDALHARKEAIKAKNSRNFKYPSHLMAITALHRHRDTNVDREERKWLSFKDLDINATTLSPTGKFNEEERKKEDSDTVVPVESSSRSSEVNVTDVPEEMKPSEFNNTYVTMEVNKPNETLHKQIEDSGNAQDEENSVEVYEGILKKLNNLGERGKNVLLKLNQKMMDPEFTTSTVKPTNKDTDAMLDELRKILVEAISEARRKEELTVKRKEANAQSRIRRELLLRQAEFTRALNEDDEKGNAAIEEDLDPDGFADDHKRINESTTFDMSNSEFWSSFSSSEEALLECDGLILNLPLTPHPMCEKEMQDKHALASQRNAITYRVPSNGYYFFVFNSENEVQKNYIRVKFDLQKTIYDVAHRTLIECRNYTEKCALPLTLFSNEKVVLELPLRNNDSLWNEEFMVISECEPRTSVYVVCVIAVPLLVVIFAFQ